MMVIMVLVRSMIKNMADDLDYSKSITIPSNLFHSIWSWYEDYRDPSDPIKPVTITVSHTGIGQVCFANSSSISIQHVFGYTTGTISPSSYIYGTESGVNTAFTTSAVLVNNIPSLEVVYWSPVYYYDLETEKNQYNQSIAVINAAYASEAATQLNNLLNQ